MEHAQEPAESAKVTNNQQRISA